MSPTDVKLRWPIASVVMVDAYTDFILSRQAMLGHASLNMVYHYAQMTDEDLLQARRQHGPIDNLG